MSGTVNIFGRKFAVVGAARGNDRSHPSPTASKPKRNKYNARSVVIDGIRFASQAEADRDAELQILAKRGVIFDLKRQPKFPLIVNGVKVGTYIADWRYREAIGIKSAINVVEDKKGVQTPAFRLKWKLAQALYPSVNSWRLS